MADGVGRPGAYSTVVDAIEAGDPDRAAQAATNLLEPATVAMLAVIAGMKQ